MIWLGVWQLGRAEEKIAQQERWETLQPEEWPLPGRAIEGQPVIIEGRYIPGRQWLLDNRTRDGQAGYEVVTLFEPTKGDPVLINRGWIAGTRDRARLPDVSVDDTMETLETRAAEWPQPPVLGEVELTPGWPKRVQALTPALAVESSPMDLGKRGLSETFLRLADPGQPGALRADWAPDRLGADTHYGYAAQWFGLAIVLVVLSLVASFRKHRSTDSSNDR